MIDEVSIQGLGVIDRAVLRWGPGLTVLTGETGAGKTMVLTALGLILGDKADPSLVRQGAQRLEVEVVLSEVPQTVVERVEDAGGSLDAGTLVLARVVGDQRARAFAGGRSVPAALLAELGEQLIAVHGQSEQILLRRASAQREALDRFLGSAHLSAVEQHRATWAEHRAVEQQLAALSGGRAERAARRDFLARGVEEVAAASPEPGEDERLRGFIERAQNVDTVRQATDDALRALNGDDANGEGPAGGAIPSISAARRALDSASADAIVAELGRRAVDIAASVDALSQDLSAFLSELDVDPRALEAALDRRGRLRELRRRWCDSDPLTDDALAAVVDHADALIAWRSQAQVELAEADDATALEALRAREAELVSKLRDLQKTLTRRRKQGAATLAKAVSTEVQALGMPTTTLVVQVTPAAEAGPSGNDEVSLGLVAHEGAAPVPLHKGASGGELSRVMLGLEVVLAGNDPVATYVFDEVDAGIGGEAALAVGQRLAQLGRTAQVLVVTHLAQVAAFADHHFVVTKGSSGGVTASDVRRVDDAERATELARMLAGMSQSERGRAHADELLQKAGEMIAGRSA